MSIKARSVSVTNTATPLSDLITSTGYLGQITGKLIS